MIQEYAKFDYSKNQIIKASQKLVENDLSLEDKILSFQVLAAFRSAHEYPLQSMIGYFRKKAFEIDKNAIVVSRLKRIPSIINKLKRIPTMKVTTMGDIGGVRIITANLANVQKIRDIILAGLTHNKLLNEKDYLESPKNSGYRGIHLTYSYQGKKKAYKGFRVELQIRSKIQHAWATAVEVTGTFLQQSLKASQGDEQWLAFFKSVSLAFASEEGKQPISKELQQTLKKQINELKVFDILNSFSVAAKHSDEKDGFYLIFVDIEAKKVSLHHYKNNFLQEAFDEYRRLEQEIADDTTKDAVLVSAKSLKELKQAYPNYLANTRLFVSRLREIVGLNHR